MNCGAIPRELIESELFGSEKGAYTGSVRTRSGLVGALLRTPAFKAEEAAIRARAQQLLDYVGIGKYAEFKARTLSYGDQRRLEIARALATEPEVLLLDEPFAGLGAGEIAALSQVIREVHQRAGLTIMLIEHKLREFMQLVSRVIAIDFGEIIATGSPQEIVDHPLVIEAYIGKQDEGHAAPH